MSPRRTSGRCAPLRGGTVLLVGFGAAGCAPSRNDVPMQPDAGTWAMPGDAATSVDAPGDVQPSGAVDAEASEDATCGSAREGSSMPNWPMPDPSTSGTPHSQSYEIPTPDAVVDRVTGLMWQRNLDGKSYRWSEAAAYCDCLALGGYDDWRLPTRIELVSIVDFTQADPAIDRNAFPSTPGDYFWTSSVVAGGQPTAWYVYFADGNTHNRPVNEASRVRCVRGGSSPPATPYQVAGDGTVLDEGTGLTWQQTFDTMPRTWADAKSACNGLTLAGGGWRLPNMKELQTLIDETKLDPAIDLSAFPGTQGQAFWTASPLAGALPDAWFVNFYAGVSYSTAETNLYRARCVR